MRPKWISKLLAKKLQIYKKKFAITTDSTNKQYPRLAMKRMTF